MIRSSPIGLFLAVLLAASVPLGPASGVEVSDLAAFPNPFSPNEDGIYDAVEISYVLSDSARVEVDIVDSLGIVVSNLNAQHWDQEPGTYEYTWSGYDDSSILQSDGWYTLVVDADTDTSVVNPSGEDHHELIIVLDTEPPSVGDLLVSPSRFTPDGDGVADSVRVRFTLASHEPTDRFWVTIIDPADESPFELLSGTGAESVEVYWNGSNPEGAAAPDTVYRLVVSAVDAAGNGDESETLLDLDLDPPFLSIVFVPDPEVAEVRVETDTTTVVGSAYDRAGVDYVEVSVDGGETWTTAQTRVADREEQFLEWSFDLECVDCELGVRDDTTSVLVRAHDATLTSDGLGHYNTSGTVHPSPSFDVVFDVAGPVHVGSSADAPDATYEAGQKITITTEWDAPGYTIEADFFFVDSAVDSMFDMSDVESSYSGGVYTIEYTTSVVGNTKVPAYDKEVRIRATDVFGRRADPEDATVTITVLEAGGALSGLSVDKNWFDPSASEFVTIGLGEGDAGATVDVYNMAGTLVRALEAGGSGEVIWNGRNGNGDVVASGVYFLHITTDSGNATRTVAIVK